MIPWRMKSWVSESFPLIYYLVNSGMAGANSAAHWDEQLAKTWNDAYRDWPAVNEFIRATVDPETLLLDVGCGTGSLLRHLSEAGYTRLHGMELSAYAIRRLLREGFCIHSGNLPTMPFPADTFGAVVLSQVLEHVIRRKTLLQEIRRILVPGGRFLVFVPDDCQGPIDEPEHVIKFTEASLRQTLSTHFAVDRLEHFRDPNHKMPYLFAMCSKKG